MYICQSSSYNTLRRIVRKYIDNVENVLDSTYTICLNKKRVRHQLFFYLNIKDDLTPSWTDFFYNSACNYFGTSIKFA